MSHKISFDKEQKMWIGPQAPYPFGKLSVGEVAYNSMAKELDHVCQISDDSGEIYTNERMLKAGISFVNSAYKRGLKKGDAVVVLVHNYHYVLPSYLGCILGGFILCPIHFLDNSVKEEIMEIIEKLHPKMMITSFLDLVAMFKSILYDLKIDCPIFTYENQIPGCHDLKPVLEDYATKIEDFVPASVTDPASDTLMIVLSSATTGKPKLINSTHKQCLVQFIDDYSHFTVATTAQPGWHSEFIYMAGVLLRNCCRVIRVNYTIDEYLRILEKYKVTAAMVKPKDIFEMLKTDTIKKVDLSELLFVMSAGQHLSSKLAKEFQEYIPNGILLSLYGNSEFGGGTAEPSDLDPDTPGLVGKVKKNFKYYVLNEAGNRLAPNELGEICMTSNAPFAGYYNDEKLSKACLTPDGFYYSGDMGYLDEDGNIFLSDRKKFNISYKGKVINQWEIEKIIIENIQGVSEACVVDAESDKHGVIPYIAIVPEKGVTLNGTNIINTIMKHHLFTFETKVFFFDKLPITISGKYKNYLIRDMILKQLSNQAQ